MRELAIVAAGLACVAIHEAAHVVAALSLGVRVKRVGVAWRGPYIVREAGPDWKNLAISLAGPLSNLATAYACLVFHRWPFLWFFSVVLGVWNLLPIPSGDGHRIARLVLRLSAW